MKGKLKIKTVLSACLLLLGLNLVAQTAEQDEFLKTIQAELNRNMSYFKKQNIPVYLLSYRIDETQSYYVRTSFGVVQSMEMRPSRVLTVQVRIGDYNLDNFHELRDDVSEYFSGYSYPASLSMDNNSKSIAQTLWAETEKTYRAEMQRYEKVKANVAVKVKEDDNAPDFSAVTPARYYEKRIVLDDKVVNLTTWAERLCKYSKMFDAEKTILDGSSNLRFSVIRKYYVTSEGTSIVQNSTYCHVFIDGMTQAEDGMELPLYKHYFAHTPAGLPNDEMMMNDTKTLVQKLKTIRTAPLVDSYTGPAVLSNDAAGVFFHEIFGHRVEGRRLKSENDGQTFKKKLNEVVLNTNISVVFDPIITEYKGIPLNGSFVYDDEGVKGEKVVVVDKGVLKNFLMTRTPIDSFPRSNGHARAEAGFQPVSRQSNLIVETTIPYTDEQLRKMLIDEAKSQGKEYGYFFGTVNGGFTMTGRFMPNSFNVTPIEVYRVYVDGRPDELVRGVDLVGTPLSMFSKVGALGNIPGNFAGTCGAESGGIPAGCCSPAVFVKQIEMQKKDKSQNRPPILPRP